MEKVVSIRGAITVRENSIAEIKKAVSELLKEIIKQNNIESSNIINIIFTATHDLNAIHPATVAREALSLDSIPMICSQEIKVPTDLPRCLRVMVQVYTKLSQNQIKHIYLGDAVNLRPDLSFEI